jgi:hypothetical protein
MGILGGTTCPDTNTGVGEGDGETTFSTFHYRNTSTPTMSSG